MVGAGVRLILALTAATLISAHLAAHSRRGAPQPEVKEQSSATDPQKDSSQSIGSLELPITFERRVGDLDGMVKRREIRALVVASRSGFFYDKGHPEGIYFEALDEFQRFVNKRFRTGSLKINVTYLPVRPEQLEKALLEGVGDVIAYLKSLEN